MPVQPSYQPSYQINMKPVYQLLAFIALLVAAILVLTAVSASTACHVTPPNTWVTPWWAPAPVLATAAETDDPHRACS